MISRSTLYSSPGGDTIQINNTAAYLRYLGVDVDIRLTNDLIDYKDYDLIHFFNIIRPADIVSHIVESKLPFVVSTIYVDYSEYEKKNRKGLLGAAFRFFSADTIEYFKCIARYVKNNEPIRSNYYLLNGHHNSIKYVAKEAKFLLPNSASEYKRFVNSYSIERPYYIIPNAIDSTLFKEETTPNSEYLDHVVCVGRIEGRKNQLNVVKALLQTDYSLDIIGKASPNHIQYLNECRQMASSSNRIRFIDHLKQDDLAPIYQAASVHVLASWFETTGLSTLEAALMGCNIVITEKGDTYDYFGDYAFYCDPGSVDSIKSKIVEAYNSPFPEELRKNILSNYTWEITAQKTLYAYERALNESVVLS
ncbi:glycosyltransferase [Spirosoma humi]